MTQTQVERLFIKDRTSLQAETWRVTTAASLGNRFKRNNCKLGDS